ncbi:hypothetical protein [Pseudomonas indica]|uniref:Uncharacterized protein n=1 Tax=Pseudomonas indica TaxID=137658 RepID=A0A1G8U3V8_9PSED|nr:hypothetical protein [Pseudomonas indica]SDJ48409.1 hypothetical protein SAMN05216186_101562 [Pseudomonas indica]
MHVTSDAALLFSQERADQAMLCDCAPFSPYPKKIFLGGKGLFAYHATMMISDNEFEQFRELVEAHFDLKTISPEQEVSLRNSDGTALKLSIRQEFNGWVIEMITNSKALLDGLDASFKMPPPPWTAFPKMEPIEAVMSKQGSLEYWWNWFWSPFWDHADSETRKSYLRDHKASEEWAECLIEHPTSAD